MDTKERKRIVAATLKWCNERRKEKGLKPLKDLPKGERYNGSSCPCGEACGYYVGYVEYWERVGGVSDYAYSNMTPLGALPSEVNRFARAFDNYEFPEYVREE